MPPAATDTDLSSAAYDHRLASPSNPTNGVFPNIAHKTAAQENNTFRARDLIYTRTTSPRHVPSPAEILASPETICTDHMIVANWSASTGWSAPELRPYGPLTLMPTASVLHYATECFEGLKAYRGYDGRLRLFRPDCNARRMHMSAARIALPVFDPVELEALILALVAEDGARWLPRDRAGQFLYLRPTLIGSAPQLGVAAPREAMFFLIASYIPRFDTRPRGLALHTSPDDMVRAWVGGFGFAKVGANYGPSLLATREAASRGFDQILWLYGKEGLCTEAGASNFFVVWRATDDENVVELVTAPLDDRLILDGVTRRSVLELARTRLGSEVRVVERKFTITEVIEAWEQGRLLESFAVGTAFFVSPIAKIRHRETDVVMPVEGEGKGGPITNKLKAWMTDIMYGNEEHEWGVVVKEKPAATE